MFVLLLKFEEFPGGGEEHRHIESLVFSSTSWGGHVFLSSPVSLLPFLLHGARQSEQIWHCRFSSYHGHEKETYICGWIIQNNKQHCHWDWADVLLLLLTMIRTRQSALACTLIKGQETVTSLPPIYKLLPLNSYLSANNNLKEYQAHEPYM